MKTYDLNAFPTRLSELLKETGASKGQLSRALFLSRNAITHYTKGHNSPSADTLARIALFFDVSTDWLLGLSDAPRPTRKEGEEQCTDTPQ